MKACSAFQHQNPLSDQFLSNQGKHPAIHLDNVYGLYTVWEYRQRSWVHVITTRLWSAREQTLNKTIQVSNRAQSAVCSSESEATPRLRLLFPTYIDPNKVPELHQNFAEITNLYPIELKDQEKILEKIVKYPGQNSVFLGKKLQMKYNQLTRHLRILGKQGKIYYRCAENDGKTKLYFAS